MKGLKRRTAALLAAWMLSIAGCTNTNLDEAALAVGSSFARALMDILLVDVTNATLDVIEGQ